MKNQQISDTSSDVTVLKHEILSNGLSVDYALYRECTDTRIFYSVGISFSDGSESAFVHDVAGTAEDAYYIFDLITRGTVTPCCAHEVIEDIIASL
jgi:hypothetical protein